jgi:hypothetical protein
MRCEIKKYGQYGEKLKLTKLAGTIPSTISTFDVTIRISIMNCTEFQRGNFCYGLLCHYYGNGKYNYQLSIAVNANAFGSELRDKVVAIRQRPHFSLLQRETRFK